jgi:hypothetical protein
MNAKMLNLTNLYTQTTRRRYPCFDVYAGLGWSNDADSCAGGSVAIDGAFSDSSKVVTLT